MKPIPSISSNQHRSRRDNRACRRDRSFPLTDYNFQVTLEGQPNSSAFVPGTKLRAFRKLSSEFFGAETNRAYIAELLLFILITGVSAWPIISMIAALARMIK
jgi:hypothetical protein